MVGIGLWKGINGTEGSTIRAVTCSSGCHGLSLSRASHGLSLGRGTLKWECEIGREVLAEDGV